MIAQDIIKKIKCIEIYTRRLLNGSLVGDTRSALKGSGFELDQIRNYQLGDDVRSIDWNSSARMNILLVKQYIEERNRTVIVAVDVSSSTFYASQHSSKFDAMAQVAGILSLVADYGKDCSGLLLFSDKIEHYVAPNKGAVHTRTLLRKLFEYETPSCDAPKKTSINCVLEKLITLKKKDALVFLISDFIDYDFEKHMRIAAKKYDLIAVRCLDSNERTFPSVGFLTLEDMEAERSSVIDTKGRNGARVNSFLEKRLEDQNRLFRQSGIDLLDIDIKKLCVADIVRFFRRRMMY